MKKILVIEDEPQTREILVESLEAEGFDVISAENGHIGINQVKEHGQAFASHTL
ncbi:DNA-binding response regulator, OmpR family, containings REC and winged-helix [Nostoc flagelliforme CCNUN1]|uniref:DNA-binding response regulator, OmpR family, containings REC and winged-helix n=2 Tax=Nostoc flagelliforme TaxID=1306274 RepID=A0A2K8T2W7_9NOSO|nr:DNA-binding response regulator, OmpR family, containings REC and winged-helix [Nostoc flagelliforme CCNUN1]